MTAITVGRTYLSLESGRRSHPIAANIKLLRGAMCFVNGTGYADMTSGNGLKCLGVSPFDQDNVGGADGAFEAEFDCDKAIDFAIGTAGDALTKADVGATVYAIDNATVGKTSGANTRSIAGTLAKVENGRAFVDIRR